MASVITHAAGGAPRTTDAPWPPRRYAWYVVIVLTAAYTLSYIDRQILSLLLEPVRRDLNLSDTQVSLLAGMAFAIFYVAFGIPLGWLADRGNRRKLVCGGVFVWSIMTSACGLASSFWQLFAARIGVGVGEAALSPAAYSLISDYFPPRERVAPLATYNLALAIGSGAAYMAGGAVSSILAAIPNLHLPLLGPVRPWQLTFMAVGAPGVIFALIVLTIREPLRRGLRVAAAPSRAPLREALSFICRENPQTFAVIFLAFGGFAIHSVSVTLWMPTLFMRRFGWTTAQIGLTLGPVILVAASTGILASMAIAARLKARGSQSAMLLTSLVMGLAVTPLGIALPLAGSATMLLILLAPVAALSFGIFAMVPPILQLITPNQLRGQVTAIFAFFNNVIGLMLGATYVALITDYVFGDKMRIHHSLVVVAATVLPLSCGLTWWGLAHFKRSLATAESWIFNAADADRPR